MQIVWTKQSEDSFNATIDYLLEIWTEKEAHNFIGLVEGVIGNIEVNSKLFKVSIFDKESREAVITKHASMFYRILNDNTIEIEYFWNNYSNPKTQKESINP